MSNFPLATVPKTGNTHASLRGDDDFILLLKRVYPDPTILLRVDAVFL